MNIIPLLILLLIPLSIFAGILYGIWKFTLVILERREIKHAKQITFLVCLACAVLIIFWLNASLSGTRWLGC